jgi:uncharacterized membrane-anchored protein
MTASRSSDVLRIAVRWIVFGVSLVSAARRSWIAWKYHVLAREAAHLGDRSAADFYQTSMQLNVAIAAVFLLIGCAAILLLWQRRRRAAQQT